MNTTNEPTGEVMYRLTPLGRALGCLHQIQAELSPLHPLQERVRVAIESLDQHSRELAAEPNSQEPKVPT